MVCLSGMFVSSRSGSRDVGYRAGRTPQVTAAKPRTGEERIRLTRYARMMRDDPLSLPAAQ